ncbi:MAG: GAF domain-containing protein [Myxococcales bacterium]|nr:GAF domain-containing protein [Myxococcales bacterium]
MTIESDERRAASTDHPGLLSGVLDSLREGLQVIDENYKYVFLNKEAEKHARKPRAELIGRTMFEIYPGIGETPMFARLRRCMERRNPDELENEFVYPDGSRRWYELRVEPVPEGVVVLSIDITARKRDELELIRVNRALATLSEANKSLAVDEATYLREACRTIVTTGGYRGAWIGLLAGPEPQSLRVLAADAACDDPFAWADELCAAATVGDGVAGRALRGRTPLIEAPEMPPHASDAPTGSAKTSSPAQFAAPLWNGEQLLGVLLIDGDGPEPFVPREGSLLEELASDLARGIQRLRDLDQRRQRDDEIQLLNRRLERLASVARDLAEARDLERIGAIASQAARELLDADGAHFVVADGDHCLYLHEDAASPRWRGRRVHRDECICGWAMHHGRTVAIEDVFADPRVSQAIYRATSVKSVVAAPTHRDGPPAAIVVYWTSARRVMPGEIRLIEALADATSVAMRNAETHRKLIDSEARRRAVFAHMPHPTFIWRKRGADFELVDLTDEARARFDEPDTLIGRLASSLEANIPDLLASLQDALESGRPLRRDVTATFPGAPRASRLEMTFSSAPDDVVIAHANDVTQQRQIEQQLKLAQRLEAIGHLAGGVAHDMNNLLSVVVSYSEFLSDAVGEASPLLDDLLEIKNAGMRGAALTRQMLAFSSRQVLAPVVVDVNEIARGISGMLRRTMSEEIEIVEDFAADLGAIMADPTQIEQVVMNLAVNARDAMPIGGRLSIATENVILDAAFCELHIATSPGEYVSLSVSDTGMGMDEATRQRIFDPFFTTKEAGRGTGLGLATVYGIVKQSGGTIWVYSEPGLGTTFKLYFPRVDAAELQLAEPSAVDIGGDETILLVEDDDSVRQLAQRILQTCGYNVLAASNGEQALEYWAEHRGAIALLLSDSVMPRMRGHEIARRLQSEKRDLAVLLMSGYSAQEAGDEEGASMGFDFLAKPFSANALRRKVRDCLQKSPKRSIQQDETT